MIGVRAAFGRGLRGIGGFLFDFLIGDTPELFVAVLLVLGVGSLLSVVAGWKGAAAIALPLLVLGALTVSVRLGRAER
jgi:hypothetical protein